MSDTPLKPPLQRDFNLGRLSDAGAEIQIAPGVEELMELAQWADVCSIEAFTATVELRPTGAGNFSYEARIEADLTQNCVVTLEPVKSHISRSFSRRLHSSRATRHSQPDAQMLVSGPSDDEVPEEIDGAHFDIAAPVLEEFSLAIDPYPRTPGVAFEAPADPTPEAGNPFVVLKRLKTEA